MSLMSSFMVLVISLSYLAISVFNTNGHKSWQFFVVQLLLLFAYLFVATITFHDGFKIVKSRGEKIVFSLLMPIFMLLVPIVFSVGIVQADGMFRTNKDVVYYQANIPELYSKLEECKNFPEQRRINDAGCVNARAAYADFNNEEIHKNLNPVDDLAASLSKQ